MEGFPSDVPMTVNGNDSWCWPLANCNRESAGVLNQTNTEVGGRPKLTEKEKKEKKRICDQKFKGKVKEKMSFLQGLVPGCSEVTGQVPMLEHIIGYVQSLRQQVEEHHGTNNEAVDKLNATEAPIDACLQVQGIPHNHEKESGATVHDMTGILKKLETDEESTVKLSDFTGLDGERINVGKYSIPLSLHLIVKNIDNVYGDISATSKMNPCAAETNYIMFLATVKEMSDLRLEQVTEDRILKWRDAIKDALRSNFKVEFAMEHLKKIARAYMDLVELLKRKNEALREFNFMDAAEDHDKPVSSGEQPIIDGGEDDVCRPPTEQKRQPTADQVKQPEPKKRKLRLGGKEIGLQPQ